MAKKEAAEKLGWDELNETLRTNPTEAQVLSLLEAEMNGAKRMNFMSRIHGKYNVLRAARERIELAKGTFKVTK